MYSLQGTIDSGRQGIRDYTDDELVELVEQIKKENRIMEIENEIFENFLKQIDPKLLQGMTQLLDQVSKIAEQMEQAQASLSQPPSQEKIALSKSRSYSSIGSLQSKFSCLTISETGKRVNLYTRIDIVKKEKETAINLTANFLKNAKLKRDNLKAELEEINLRIAETKEARDIFEQTIVKEGVDLLTQRIPAEKFIRYMEEWLKSAESIIEKLRLKTCNLTFKRTYLQNQLKQKEELGETLHPVDLDQLKIDNQILNKKLEEKNLDLLDLKKKSGEANLILSKHKGFLQSRIKVLNQLIDEITIKKKKKKSLLKEVEIVTNEVKVSEDKLNQISHIVDNYTVPDLIEYVKKKNEMYILKNNIKIWLRRNNIQKNALDACIKTMKLLKRTKVENPEWFIIPGPKTEEENVENRIVEI